MFLALRCFFGIMDFSDGDLEDEIGVDFLHRSPRGVTLTADGKLFLEEVRELLKRADESMEKVRARDGHSVAIE
jgi:DNA-binding transcriptional LysR family regulator